MIFEGANVIIVLLISVHGDGFAVCNKEIIRFVFCNVTSIKMQIVFSKLLK